MPPLSDIRRAQSEAPLTANPWQAIYRLPAWDATGLNAYHLSPLVWQKEIERVGLPENA